jgi:hypothetical protein
MRSTPSWWISKIGRRILGGTFACQHGLRKTIRIRCGLICTVIRVHRTKASRRFGLMSAPRKARHCGLPCSRSPWVEPSPFVSNWHIECMCEHFEGVSHRQILRLLINIPPRHSKSLGLNVFFPAWVWAQNPDPDGQHPERSIRSDCWMDRACALPI